MTLKNGDVSGLNSVQTGRDASSEEEFSKSLITSHLLNPQWIKFGGLKITSVWMQHARGFVADTVCLENQK